MRLFACVVELPSHRVLRRVELRRVARSPQGDRVTLVEHPSHREREHRHAITLARVSVERCHRREVLREPGLLELGVVAAQVVADELASRE